VFLRRCRYRYKGEVREYAQIVENYRDERGKVKQRIVKSLWRIDSEADWERAKKLLGRLKAGEKLVTLSDLKIKRCLEFGPLYVAEKVWEDLGMPKILEGPTTPKRRFDFGKVVFLLTVNRLSEPKSELRAYEWIQEEAFVEGKEEIAEQHLYRALDLLVANKTKIERAIFNRLKRSIDLSKVFYDLTSSYFEGNTCVLAEFGYSRDKKLGKKQLVLGIVLADGLPIAHFVFPGSTTDKTTLRQTIEYLKREFKLERVIFVGDRGLVSEENLEFLEQAGLEYILATKRRTGELVRELTMEELTARDKIEEWLYAREVRREGNRRFILCLNSEVREQTLEELDHLRVEAEEKLERLGAKLAGSKKRGDLLNKLVKRTIGNASKFFEWELSDGKFSYSLRKAVWNYERAIAGRFLLVTTARLSQSETMLAYKQLAQIERVFQELKSFVRLRPIFHRKESRVKAHVFVCVLALLLEAMMQKKLNVPARRALQKLKRVRVAMMDVEGEEVGVLTELDEEQMRILKELEVETPPRIL